MKKQKPAINIDINKIISNSIRSNEIKKLVSDKPLDIITFAKTIGKVPYKAQEIILKMFYAGTHYNEDLQITEEEIEIINNWSIPQHWITEDEKSKLKALQENREKFKQNPHNYFHLLVLVIGRRSGKSWLTSLVAVYEAYKLLCLFDPVGHYNLDGDIYIINTAVTANQAKTIVFKTIREFVHQCPFLEDRICDESDDAIVFYTDKDLETNKRLKEKGAKEKTGSVVIVSGNSNSAALRGHTSSCIVYDEMAHYVDTAGKASSAEVYAALSPSATTMRVHGEGRNIIISSPDLPGGFFYNQFKKGQTNDNTLVFQIPTWDANPNYTREMLNSEFETDPDHAMAEYGAQFRTMASSSFITHEMVDYALYAKENWLKQERGEGCNQYYMHIDPATKTDRWAVLILHPERRYNPDTRSFEIYVVEDWSKAFSAAPGQQLDPDLIMDDYIIPLFKKFNIISVTSDQFFSLEQAKKLKNLGIHYKEMSYNGQSKNKIYSTMKNYFTRRHVILCNDDIDLAGELKNIKIDYTRNPPKISKQADDPEYPNDDLVDCLGGAIFSMSSDGSFTTKLPTSSCVRIGRRL